MKIVRKRLERNQIDLIGFQTTSPFHALSGFTENTLPVFFIIVLILANASITGNLGSTQAV